MRSPVVVLGTLTLVLAGAGPAAAEAPLSVSDRVTDEAGVLGTDEPAVRAAVDELATATGIEVHAVLVSSFDSEGDSDWTDLTARLSELGGSDLLLAVAVGEDTYEYGWWVDDTFPLSEVEVEDVVTSEVVPQLEAGNWDVAVTTLAEELQSLSDSAADEPPTPAWSATATMLTVGGLAVVLVGAHLLSRRRTTASQSS